MTSQHIATLADPAQLKGMLKGGYLLGRPEPRVAWVGRSNVGKSSLINALLGARLAHVSKTPGRTREVHFYSSSDLGCILVDLPGYGFAKARKDDIERWAKFIDAYLRADSHLARVMVLLDARHGPTDSDIQVVHYLRDLGLDVRCVFTKCDALKNQSERVQRRRQAGVALAKIGVDSASTLWVSSRSGDGMRALESELRNL